MATRRLYTDFKQSERLEEILSPESADMKWFFWKTEIDAPKVPTFGYSKATAEFYKNTAAVYLPCWSLAALLSVLPPYQLQTQDNGIGILCSCNGKFIIVTADNPIDACYEMILELHKQNLL